MIAQSSSGVIEIRDPAGSVATINTDYGFNCSRFAVATAGNLVEVIWSESGFGPGSAPDLSGIPVLFPFGGRMRSDSYTWRGNTYTIVDGIVNNGVAMHGFVLNRPWRVIDQRENSVTGEFQASVDDPLLLGQWPADFLIRMTYTISATSLDCAITIENPDTRPLPYGFATHGYFRTPLASGDGEQCQLTIPAASTWLLGEDGVPTGDIRPVDTANDQRSGSAIAGRQFNTVYTDLIAEPSGAVVCSLADPNSEQVVRIETTGGFREVVVWNPAHRESIAIEPYTCCPTTFDLEERGYDAGLRVLEPGASDELRIAISLDKGEFASGLAGARLSRIGVGNAISGLSSRIG